jgi:hypothetical protein
MLALLASLTQMETPGFYRNEATAICEAVWRFADPDPETGTGKSPIIF